MKWIFLGAIGNSTCKIGPRHCEANRKTTQSGSMRLKQKKPPGG